MIQSSPHAPDRDVARDATEQPEDDHPSYHDDYDPGPTDFGDVWEAAGIETYTDADTSTASVDLFPASPLVHLGTQRNGQQPSSLVPRARSLARTPPPPPQKARSRAGTVPPDTVCAPSVDLQLLMYRA